MKLYHIHRNENIYIYIICVCVHKETNNFRDLLCSTDYAKGSVSAPLNKAPERADIIITPVYK